MTSNVTKTVQEKAHAGADAAAQAAHDVIDRAAQRAQGSEQYLRDSAQQAGKKMKKSWKQARSKSVEAQQAVNGFMRRHPLLTLGIAVGIGALLMSGGRQRPAPETVEEGDSALH